MSDLETYKARYERHRQHASRANALNKAAVFDALAAAGISDVTVTFDGYGDSGQIEGITAHSGETPKALPAPPSAATPANLAPLPEMPMTLHQATWDSDELGTCESTLQDAIETLCYDYLEQEHGGWMDNDGACGEFEFDVAARAIHLEFNGRFTDVYTQTHEF